MPCPATSLLQPRHPEPRLGGLAGLCCSAPRQGRAPAGRCAPLELHLSRRCLCNLEGCGRPAAAAAQLSKRCGGPLAASAADSCASCLAAEAWRAAAEAGMPASVCGPPAGVCGGQGIRRLARRCTSEGGAALHCRALPAAAVPAVTGPSLVAMAGIRPGQGGSAGHSGELPASSQGTNAATLCGELAGSSGRGAQDAPRDGAPAARHRKPGAAALEGEHAGWVDGF